MANEIQYRKDLVKGTLYAFRRSGYATRVFRYLEEAHYFILHGQRVADLDTPDEPIESCYYTHREIFTEDGKGIIHGKFTIQPANEQEEHYYNVVLGLTLTEKPRTIDSHHYSIY